MSIDILHKNDDDSLSAARAQWNNTACGTGDYLNHVVPETLEWFDAIRHSRYHITDKWMLENIDFSSGKDKKVLEIGHGIGSDLLTWSENGADVYGVDITEEHHRLAKKNFKLHGRDANLQLVEAQKLPFKEDEFDIIYSNGVLHHTKDVETAIQEIKRVLRKNGKLIITVYNKNSLFHYLNLILYNGILKAKLRRIGYSGLLATIEYGADGIEYKPYVKLYTKNELKKLLDRFRNVKIKNVHFTKKQIPFFWRFIPNFLEEILGKYWGWYIVVEAKK